MKIESELRACIGALDASKRAATGLPLAPLPYEHLPSSITSASEFDSLVTIVFRWYWEALQDDRGAIFPFGFGDLPHEVRLFNALLPALRHASQHQLSPQDTKYIVIARWTEDTCGEVSPSTPPAWNACRERFLADLGRAILAHLQQVTAAGDVDSWRRAASTTPEATMREVYQDLGLSAHGRQFDFDVRSFKSNYKRQGLDPSAQRAYAAIAALGGRLDRLPVSYAEVLDALGLIGAPNAVAGLMIAHGVQGAVRIAPSDFIDRVVGVWIATTQ